MTPPPPPKELSKTIKRKASVFFRPDVDPQPRGFQGGGAWQWWAYGTSWISHVLDVTIGTTRTMIAEQRLDPANPIDIIATALERRGQHEAAAAVRALERR